MKGGAVGAQTGDERCETPLELKCGDPDSELGGRNLQRWRPVINGRGTKEDHRGRGPGVTENAGFGIVQGGAVDRRKTVLLQGQRESRARQWVPNVRREDLSTLVGRQGARHRRALN